MLTDGPENGSHQREWLNIIVILAAIAFVVSILLLVRVVKRGVEPQNCHMAGFNNCDEVNAPLITAPHRRARLE
jgi:hypothetical protein